MILEYLIPLGVLLAPAAKALVAGHGLSRVLRGREAVARLATEGIPDTDLVALVEVNPDGTFLVPSIIQGEVRMYRVNPEEERTLVAARQLAAFLDGDGDMESLEGVFLCAQVVEEVEMMAKGWEGSPHREVRKATKRER